MSSLNLLQIQGEFNVCFFQSQTRFFHDESLQEMASAVENHSYVGHDRSKNRYSNVFPSKLHRILLGSNAYINADLIETAKFGAPHNFICTQAPIKDMPPKQDTVSDFWDMVFEQR